MNIVLLENSNTLSRMGDLIFATIFGYTKSPRKTKKSQKIDDTVTNGTRKVLSAIKCGGETITQKSKVKVEWME